MHESKYHAWDGDTGPQDNSKQKKVLCIGAVVTLIIAAIILIVVLSSGGNKDDPAGKDPTNPDTPVDGKC